MAKPSQTSILVQLLAAAVPGAHDETLDDVAIYGPRGGMHGYERAPGAERLGDPAVSRATNAAAAHVRHGRSFYDKRGPRGMRSGTQDTGPTFAVGDLPAIRACAWAAQVRQPEVLTLLATGDTQAAAAKAAETHAAMLAAAALQAKNRAAASNPSTPSEVLANLAEDDDEVVRVGVAYNPTTSPEVLLRLAGDADWSVRLAVVRNPRTPPEAYTILASGDDQHVLEALATNEAVATEIRMAAQLRAAR